MKIIEIVGPTKEIWYHRTTPDRVESIAQHGLVVDSKNNLTESGEWSFEIYGCRPIFLSKSSGTQYAPHAEVLYKVDVSGLELVADLPSLVDEGAYYDADEDIMWWKNDDLEFSLSALVQDGPDAEHAIRMTKTAACLHTIHPDRLTKVS